jgi:hypothetical protein
MRLSIKRRYRYLDQHFGNVDSHIPNFGAFDGLYAGINLTVVEASMPKPIKLAAADIKERYSTPT